MMDWLSKIIARAGFKTPPERPSTGAMPAGEKNSVTGSPTLSVPKMGVLNPLYRYPPTSAPPRELPAARDREMESATLFKSVQAQTVRNAQKRLAAAQAAGIYRPYVSNAPPDNSVQNASGMLSNVPVVGNAAAAELQSMNATVGTMMTVTADVLGVGDPAMVLIDPVTNRPFAYTKDEWYAMGASSQVSKRKQTAADMEAEGYTPGNPFPKDPTDYQYDPSKRIPANGEVRTAARVMLQKETPTKKHALATTQLPDRTREVTVAPRPIVPSVPVEPVDKHLSTASLRANLRGNAIHTEDF